MLAADIHARLGAQGWVSTLGALGIPESALSTRKNRPCPACGGEDRFSFDNRHGRGDFFCRQCGPGSGFDLLMRVHGWTFRRALIEVARVAGLEDAPHAVPIRQVRTAPAAKAAVSRRALTLLRESCAVADCLPVVRYLLSRNCWPLPAGHCLRAHASAEYWFGAQMIGRFPALLAPVVSIDGELVSLHATYLTADGQKLGGEYPARKLLSKLDGHRGCAVRLMPMDTDTLGIGEGIETCLSASALHGVPVWSALNTALLVRFEPPPSVHRLMIFADNDAPGLRAAIELRERLDGRCTVETRIPHAGDWNDA